jgi:hypothetical protein
MSTTIASSSYRLPGHNPIHYDGSNYYAVTVDDTNHKAHVYKASSISGTWTEQDSSTTVPSSGDFDQTNPWLCSFLDSTGIIHIAGILTGFGDFYALRFDTSTDQWYDYGAGTYQTSLGGDLSFAGNSAHFCEQGNGDIVAVFSGDAESYHGDNKRRIDYRASTNNGTSWGSTTALDGGGDVHYGNSVCAPGATSTEFHCYAQRQTSTVDDPPVAWSSAWRTGNTSNSPTAGGSTYDTVTVLRGFKHLVETNDTNEFRVIGFNGASVINHVLNEANPIAEITAYSSSVTPAKGSAENAAPSAVAESDGSKLYIVYPDSTSSDIYLLTATAADDALDSTTATEIFDGVTATYVDVSLVSTDLIVVWDNGSSIEVDTYSTSADVTITFQGDPPDGNGEVTLAGKVPTVHWTVTPVKGTATLAGKVPILDLAVSPARDELDLTGKVSTVHWSITPTKGELDLTGKQATVHWSITPGRYELTLTGYQVSIPVSVPSSSVSLAGKTPTVHWSITPTEGELDLTGKVSVLDLAIESDREELSLTGKIPVAALGIVVGKGTLTLTGKVPTLHYTIIYDEAIDSVEIIEKTPRTPSAILRSKNLTCRGKLQLFTGRSPLTENS